jgi:HSP20 family protein
MNIVPWKKNENNSPFNALETLHREMGRIFDDPFFRLPEFSVDTKTKSWTPMLDVKETKDAYLIEADIPGLDKKDLHVSLKNEVLTIKGIRSHEVNKEEDGWVHKERSYGTFYRSVQLPTATGSKEAQASYKDGVLKLSIPKQEPPKETESNIKIT